MERVNYKVAKAIKSIGYPQEWYDCEYYYTETGELKRCDDYEGNSVEDITYNQRYAIPAPYYVEVWFWLWRTKKVELSLEYGIRMNDVDETLYCLPLKYHSKSHPDMKYIIQEMNYDAYNCCSHGYVYEHKHADPEEAIINAINYLVENGLLH